jgi:hypothetical protein
VDFWEFAARSEWPIVVGGTILLLRRPLAAMFERVTPTKVDAWGLKAEFEHKLNEIEQITASKEAKDQIPAIAMDEASKERKLLNDSIREAFSQDLVSPATSVLETWSDLESYMQRVLNGQHPEEHQSLRTTLATSAEKLGLSPAHIKALMALRELRNNVAHAKDASITWEDAVRYKLAATALIEEIQKIAYARAGQHL